MSKSLDRLTLLATFVRIAERGSISAAARDLGLSQASASRQLADLENRLGRDLIRRTTHSLSLTAAGLACLKDARALLGVWEHFEETHAASDTDIAGELRVVAPLALGLTDLYDAALTFQAQHAGISLDWDVDDSEIAFTERGCDVWLRVGQPKDDSLIVKPLGRIERMIVAAPKTLAGQQTESPNDLNGKDFIALSAFDGVRIPLTETEQTGKDRAPTYVTGQTALATNNILASHRAALAGVGYAVMPKWFIREDLAEGRLVDVLPNWRAPELSLNAAYLPSRWQPKRLKMFVDHMADAVHEIDGISPP